MSYVTKLVCGECKAEIEKSYVENFCPYCGNIIFFEYDYKKVANEVMSSSGSIDLSKILNPLGVNADDFYLGEGKTPLIKLVNIPRKLGLGGNVYIKNEAINPTGSFLDRGVSLDMVNAKIRGFKKVVAISTGNLGISVASYSARMGLNASVVVPTKIEVGKLYQLITYNVDIVRAMDENDAIKIVKEKFSGSYQISTVNPYFMEGEKMITFEIFQQLGSTLPDYIIVPMGSGGLIYNIWRGVRELNKIGLIEDIKTSLIGVQLKGCDRIVRDLMGSRDTSSEMKTKSKYLIADICVENPVMGNYAIDAIKESGGVGISVTENEVFESMRKFAHMEGLMVEPAAATTLSAYLNLINSGYLDKNDNVALIITGGGLKNFTLIREFLRRNRPILRLANEKEIGNAPYARVGFTKLKILELLKEASTIHGYEVWKRLREKFGIDITLTTVYQHLEELSNMGLIKLLKRMKEKGRKRTVFKLTNEGKKLLEIYS